MTQSSLSSLCSARRHAAALLAVLALTNAPSSAADKDPIVLETWGSFFIGGADQKSDALVRADAPYPNLFSRGGTFTSGQMYVQYKIPAGVKRTPIVFVHGCCLTSKAWETTPDGREGWETFFVRNHHPVYLVEQVGRGRSGFDATRVNLVAEGKAARASLPMMRGASHEAAWSLFRFGPTFGKAYDGLQYPLEAVGQLWAQIVPDLNDSLTPPNPTLSDLSMLARLIGPAVLVGHSQSGSYPLQTAAIDLTGIAAMVSIEGVCPASMSKDAVRLASIPTLLVYGDYVEQNGFWDKARRDCADFAEKLRQVGGNPGLVSLPEIGLLGNSHMMMQDRNSADVAAWLDSWIASHVEGAPTVASQ